MVKNWTEYWRSHSYAFDFFFYYNPETETPEAIETRLRTAILAESTRRGVVVCGEPCWRRSMIPLESRRDLNIDRSLPIQARIHVCARKEHLGPQHWKLESPYAYTK